VEVLQVKSKHKALPLRSKALFTIVGGVVLINPVFAQDQSTQELEEIIVTGLRDSLRQSMGIKRDAIGIVDAINAEDIGKFPDTNLAESLQRITGVSIDRRNGEGALVTARGFGPQFNLVTLNGRQMPGADAYGDGNSIISGQSAGSRSFSFANLSSESISAVQVYKTGRADIATGGIGAVVNIKTARPFDNDGVIVNLGGKGVMDESNPFEDEITPEASGIFSYTNDDKTWGVGLNASYSKRKSGSVQATVNTWNVRPWDGADTTIAANALIENAPAEGQLYGIPQDIRYAFSDLERERINAQAVVQFAPVDSLTLTLDYTMAEQELAEDRGEQTIWMQRNGSFDHIIFDTDNAEIATPIYIHELTGGQKDYGWEQQRNEQKNTLDSVGFNADWRATDAFSLALDFHDSKGESLPNDPITGGGSTQFSFAGTNCPVPAGSTTPSCSGFWTQAFEFGTGLPIMTRTFYPSQADAVARTNGDPDFQFDAGTIGSQVTRINVQQQTTEVTQARLDGTLDFDNGRFQFGVESREIEMNQKTSGGYLNMGNWGVSDAGQVPDMVALLTPYNLSGLFDDYNPVASGAPTQAWRGNADTLGLWAINAGHDPSGRRYTAWNEATATEGALHYNPGWANDNTVNEQTRSVYFQVAVQGKLGAFPTNLLIGARYEETDVESTAQILVPSHLFWDSNNDFQVIRSAEIQPFSEETDYSHLLPSLDFDIGLTDTVKGRFSYSKTIARADYPQLFAGATPNTPNGSSLFPSNTLASGTANNPALVPLESDNFDLSAEWYFSDTGYVSAGFWEKRVSNFIGNSVVEENLFGIRDQTAGPDAQFVLDWLNGNNADSRVWPADDTSLFTALGMYRNGGLARLEAEYDGSLPQATAAEGEFDILPNADDPLYTFSVTRPLNTEEAKIHGWEFGGQYFLGETGFGVLANYTVVRGDVEFDNTAPTTEDQFALLGLSDSANLVLMYENFGFTVRLAYNWRDKFLAQTNVGGSNRNPIYVKEYDQIDLSMGYDFNDHLSVSLEGINLGGEDVVWHARSDKQVYRLEDQMPRYAIGARYKF
jgi:TonB-dependent receptor